MHSKADNNFRGEWKSFMITLMTLLQIHYCVS